MLKSANILIYNRKMHHSLLIILYEKSDKSLGIVTGFTTEKYMNCNKNCPIKHLSTMKIEQLHHDDDNQRCSIQTHTNDN